jgi:hypothetical protein
MTPLRAEDITLYCEDREGGLSQRVLEAAIQSLRAVLPFAQEVRPVGVLSKNDVQVRTKFARTQPRPRLRVFGVRDRDFIPRTLFTELRSRAFHERADQVTPWPLPRHCIESYLLEDDVIAAAAPQLTRARIDEAAAARLWLRSGVGAAAPARELADHARPARSASSAGRAHRRRPGGTGSDAPSLAPRLMPSAKARAGQERAESARRFSGAS